MKKRLLYILLFIVLGILILAYFSVQDSYFDLLDSDYLIQQLGLE